ncbi:hypothetical protein ACJMK2_025330 [Sinanodonta woodiana]|uniref:Uncharacterized protein n=1 Tax=Sinanodonta woodiana TaxID=1069815 RepID=A0ABD3XG67_SINWO
METGRKAKLSKRKKNYLEQRKNRNHLRATNENVIDPDIQDLHPTPAETQTPDRLLTPKTCGKQPVSNNSEYPDKYQTSRGRSAKNPVYLKEYIT